MFLEEGARFLVTVELGESCGMAKDVANDLNRCTVNHGEGAEGREGCRLRKSHGSFIIRWQAVLGKRISEEGETKICRVGHALVGSRGRRGATKGSVESDGVEADIR